MVILMNYSLKLKKIPNRFTPPKKKKKNSIFTYFFLKFFIKQVEMSCILLTRLINRYVKVERV